MQSVIHDINEVIYSGNFWRFGNDFKSKYAKTFAQTLNSFTEEEKSHIEDLLYAAVKCGVSGVLESIAYPIFDKRKLIDWKNRPDIVHRVIDLVIESGCGADDPEEQRHYTSFMEKFMETLANNKILGQHLDKLFEITRKAFHTLDSPNKAIHNATLPCITKYPWKDKPEYIPEVVKLIKDAVKHNPDVPEGSWLHSNCGIALAMMFLLDYGENASDTQKAVLDDITEMFKFCADQEWKNEKDPSKHNLAYKMLLAIMEDYLKCGQVSPIIARPLMPTVKELWENGDTELQRDAERIITALAGLAELTGDQTDVLLEKYLKDKDHQIASKLQKMYFEQPEKVHPYLPRILDSFKKCGNDPMGIMPLMMFVDVAKTHPEQVTPDMIKTIASTGTYQTYCYHSMQFLDAMSATKFNDVVQCENDIINAFKSGDVGITGAGGVLVRLADTEDRQRRYLKLFADRLSNTQGPMQIMLLSNMRQIGVNCPKLFGEYRPLIQQLHSRPDLRDMCQAALDVIDGRSLEKVANDVVGQRKDINQLDVRVTNNEGEISNVKVEVGKNTEDINNIKTDVDDQGKKLDNLKVVVDETVQRVDELEKKTLSHAPSWSRDVARLLGPTSDQDWRLLASRLGYTNDDIRNWATQPEPCLSMLDEWFAAHNTREATHAVRKILVEINRTDASEIIDNALKAVQHVITDDISEPPVAPPIFLSYQWAHQPEVKLLRRHLGLAGYASWMDIGQMGGGDKLFAKIDSGIRSAKVVICCVTQKYAESANCNREVNLTTALGKPVIPLLMEKMSWPPPGAMGPIFGEYIFVRFFQRDGEKTSDDRYWPVDKFSELLIQLRYHVAPETAAIPDDSPYVSWWSPPNEMTVLKPKPNQPAAAAAKSLPSVEVPEKITSSSAPPEVFISYQWDKQEQIKALYQRLTGHGFKCWLDILQMGGGDGLFEKIDHGIRNCKVVVSCVTSKYAKSANCRREVSLADAVKKPLVPLLLEKTSWPPEGPMGPIFTQMLYIDFTQPGEDIQNHWNCPQFNNDLLQRISGHVVPQLCQSTVQQPSAAPSVETTDKSRRNSAGWSQRKTSVGSNKSANQQPVKQAVSAKQQQLAKPTGSCSQLQPSKTATSVSKHTARQSAGSASSSESGASMKVPKTSAAKIQQSLRPSAAQQQQQQLKQATVAEASKQLLKRSTTAPLQNSANQPTRRVPQTKYY